MKTHSIHSLGFQCTDLKSAKQNISKEKEISILQTVNLLANPFMPSKPSKINTFIHNISMLCYAVTIEFVWVKL